MTDLMNHLQCAFDDGMESDSDDSMLLEEYLCQAVPISSSCPQDKLDASTTRCISIGSSSTDSSVLSSAPSSPIQQHVPQTPKYTDIFDEYDIHPTILGTGNYGCVRECAHRATGRKYAVKTIDKSKVSRLDHIQNEMRLLSHVDHSSIMRMVDCFEDADYVHIITEMYTGGELFDKIVDNTTDAGCLPEHQAQSIIKSLLEAVQYLHERNIVHRDIKPENVLFVSNQDETDVKLIDFGLARTHSSSEGYMTNQVGTPYYMSPGVLQGKYDKSCDLWAIGIVAYILLAGYPPFNGNDDAEIHDSVMQGNLVFERGVWSKMSKESRDFISMLLCKDEGISAEEALRHPWVARA